MDRAAAARRGRPRLTAEELRARLVDYSRRYDVALRDDEALPPFPSGRRETAQHREWMTLYKAHRRLTGRTISDTPGTADLPRRQELLTAQRGRCLVCRRSLELAEARVDAPTDKGSTQTPAVVHPDCLRLVALARTLGPGALDGAKGRL